MTKRVKVHNIIGVHPMDEIPHYSKPIKNWDDIIPNMPKGKRAIRRQNATIAKQKAGQQ